MNVILTVDNYIIRGLPCSGALQNSPGTLLRYNDTYVAVFSA